MWTPMAGQPKSAVGNSPHALRKLSGQLKSLQGELLKRNRARNSLLTYASVMEIPGAPHSIDDDDDKQQFLPIPKAFGAHHLLWLECLQKIEDGTIKRLMGLMPPGAGKSIYSS